MELALWETLQYFKDATAGRNVNKEKAFKVVFLPPKSLVLQIFFKTVSKAPRSFFLSEYLHPHNIVNKDNYIMYFQKHYSSRFSCSSYQKYDVPQCTHTRHWDDEWNIIIWKENVIYNPNLPRIAYLHIYKLVYSSDVDYKVREEIVKMIVVQNAAVPLSRNCAHFASKVVSQQHRTCGLGGGSSGGISGWGCNERMLLDSSFLSMSRGILEIKEKTNAL